MMVNLPSGQDTAEEGIVIRRYVAFLFIFPIMIGPKPCFNNIEKRLVRAKSFFSLLVKMSNFGLLKILLFLQFFE